MAAGGRNSGQFIGWCISKGPVELVGLITEEHIFNWWFVFLSRYRNLDNSFFFFFFG